MQNTIDMEGDKLVSTRKKKLTDGKKHRDQNPQDHGGPQKMHYYQTQNPQDSLGMHYY